MKKIIFGMMILVMMSVLGNAVLGQKPRARDLFIQKENNEEKGKAGVKVRILLKRGNQSERYVSSDETFYSGDKIKLAFDINFSGHIGLFNVGSSGKVTMLYPYAGTDTRVEPNENEQLIPSNPKDWIAFDDRPGVEKITIVFSTNPLDSVDQILQKSGNTTISGGISINTSSSESQALLLEMCSRGLKRGKSRDLFIETVNKDATYVVAEPNLISEPTAFVISLKHQ